MLENRMTAGNRIFYLDGLRGVAILLVVLFHAYARWPEVVPFGTQFVEFPLFAYGWLGVNLFFMISGFVILMTLEKCMDFREFILRRWFRLFPAMLICSVLIFSTAAWFPERPGGAVVFRDLLPGLTFIQPAVWTVLLGSHQGSLEGSFWSLYAEMKFYVIFGILYFTTGWRIAVMGLTGIFFLSILPGALVKIAPYTDFRLLGMIIDIVNAKYYGWFAAGTLYYKYYCERRLSFLLSAVVIALISAWSIGEFKFNHRIIPPMLIVLLFTFSVTNIHIQKMLTRPCLLFCGYISYPLYLLHENMMVALIVKIGKLAPGLHPILMPVLPIAIVIALGWLVARFLEPWARDQLRWLYQKLCALAGSTQRNVARTNKY